MAKFPANSKAAPKKASAGKSRPKAKAAPRASVQLEHVVLAKHARDKLKSDFAVSADRAIAELGPDFPLERDAVRKIPKCLKAGQTPTDTTQAYAKGRAGQREVSNPSLVRELDNDLNTHPSARISSQRRLATKHGATKRAVSRVIRRALKRPLFKKAETCGGAQAHRVKRVAAADKILAEKVDPGLRDA